MEVQDAKNTVAHQQWNLKDLRRCLIEVNNHLRRGESEGRPSQPDPSRPSSGSRRPCTDEPRLTEPVRPDFETRPLNTNVTYWPSKDPQVEVLSYHTNLDLTRGVRSGAIRNSQTIGKSDFAWPLQREYLAGTEVRSLSSDWASRN